MVGNTGYLLRMLDIQLKAIRVNTGFGNVGSSSQYPTCLMVNRGIHSG